MVAAQQRRGVSSKHPRGLWPGAVRGRRAGRPCIFAGTTSLAELQPEGTATIVCWDEEATAARVIEWLADPAQISEHVRRINRRAAEFTWKRAAGSLLGVYEDAMASRSRDARRVAGDLVEAERERQELDQRYGELWAGLRADGWALLGPNSPLDADDQRTLLALARRRPFQRLVLRPLKAWRALRGRPPAPRDPPPTDAAAFAAHFSAANRDLMADRLQPMPNLDDAH